MWTGGSIPELSLLYLYATNEKDKAETWKVCSVVLASIASSIATKTVFFLAV